MSDQLLNIHEHKFIEELRRNTRDKNTYVKLSVLIFLDKGFGYEEIRDLLGVSVGKISNCREKFILDGLDKYLDTHYVPYQGKLTAAQLNILDEQLQDGLYQSVEQVLELIKQLFGIAYKATAVRNVLHKLGYVYKKTSSVPCAADKEAQAKFIEQIEELADDLGEDEAMFFMDAVHPQHNTRSSYAWIKKGQKKEIPSNSGRRRININGVINALQPEKVVVIEAERINAQATKALLQKLLRANPKKKKLFVLCDNARYYKNRELQQWLSKQSRLELVFLPPYSPNLNLIERLWKFLRKKVINLHFYREYDDFKNAVLNFFKDIKKYKTELRSLITLNFQQFDYSGV